jgi:hypothetical protein
MLIALEPQRPTMPPNMLCGLYEQFRAVGGADSARRHYARIAALASTYAGWSALEMSVDTSGRGDAPLPPVA